MKRTFDGTATARAVAERAINDRFNQIAAEFLQRDAEHKAKRDAAAGVLMGEQPPAPFIAEAILRGLGVEDFAEMIAGRPDNALARGLQRQTLMLAVAAATSPDAVRAVMLQAGFPPNYDTPLLPQPV